MSGTGGAGSAASLVVGGGLMGLAAARALQRRGAGPVRILERFRLGHDRGSSHGASRITRTTYGEEVYSRLMQTARAADWPELEREHGAPLIHLTGGCFFGPASTFDPVAAVAARFPEEIERLSPAEAARRFPLFRFDEAAGALADRTAGVVDAAGTLQALTRGFLGAGGTVDEETPVLELVPGGDRVRVRTGRGWLEAERVVVAAGAWTPVLVPALRPRLTVRRQHVGYFRLAGDPAAVRPDRMPVWAWLGADDSAFAYGLPEFGRPGIKAARHDVSTGGPGDDPSHHPPPSETALAGLREFLGRLFAVPVVERLHAETCLYTNAPGEDFVLDLLPGDPRVAVGAGFTGHGFKFGPLVGRILAELALDGRTSVPAFEAERARFRLIRVPNV